ncbi:Feruloyl CoA ortho-hydroxylase 1 [Spatholobus suberectus]|nr:Feruloyl CoA ortho-hydroxylase 1 [Spatholobus suberectus]
MLCLSEVLECDDVPIIDLGSQNRTQIVQQINEACVSYGFFQVINHEVPLEAVKEIKAMAHGFFKLPMEEKLKLYSEDPSKIMRLSTSFNVKKETTIAFNCLRPLFEHVFKLERTSFLTVYPFDSLENFLLQLGHLATLNA